MADSSGAIARRYARALVSIGVEGNESELIAADLARFVAVLRRCFADPDGALGPAEAEADGA